SEDAWYYADGSGNLYAGEFKTIKGKKYAFRDDGRMLDGLKFIKKNSTGLDVMASDGSLPYETEGEFDESATKLNKKDYLCYYFGDGSDGAMKTGKSSIDIDGDKFNFYFETAGSNKGAGKTGEKDKKLYQSGKLLTAGKDEKYQVVEAISTKDEAGYKKYEDAKDFIDNSGIVSKKTGYTDADLSAAHINKKAADVSEFYVVSDTADVFDLVNTSGKVITSNGKNKDGNDYNYVIYGKKIVAIYVEN
ncbi:argininosuccinate lyase, partial [Enterocloster citroniae]